jgi:hypothetical protein
MTDSRTLVGGTYRFVDLVDWRGGIDNLSATGVLFEGPAIMANAGGLEFNDCTWDAFGQGIEAVIWERSPDYPVIAGVVWINDCVFTDCLFVNVGLGLLPDQVSEFLPYITVVVRD